MRMDKFLKVSRLIKRREVAKELCDASLVLCNGKVAKPSTEVVPGDELCLTLGRHVLTVKVLGVSPYANKETASGLYDIMEDGVKERSDMYA